MLRAGVAGAGVFGGYHARKYASLPGVEISAIYDHTLAHAERLARPLSAAPFDDFDAFLAAVDIVTLATPADSHGDLAAQALAAGRPVYVEKPLATSREAAAALVGAAAQKGLVLACGHQERAVFAAMGLLGAGRPLALEAVRCGTPSERNRDVSCVLDLMIHDLDLAARLAGKPFADVSAEGSFDSIRAEVVFEGGVAARFHASRVAESRERTMHLVYADGLVEVDFLAPSFRNSTRLALDPAFAESPAGRDPLGSSVAAFVEAVRGERPRPLVDGTEGAAAMELALAIEAAAGL